MQISNSILEHLKCANLDIIVYRSQGYDNGTSIVGVHGDVQAVIKQVNKKKSHFQWRYQPFGESVWAARIFGEHVLSEVFFSLF